MIGTATNPSAVAASTWPDELATSFFPHIIRPSHYTGVGDVGPNDPLHGDLKLLWVHPGTASEAHDDPAWLWSFATLANDPEISVARYCDWSADAWARAAAIGRHPLSLDGARPVTQFDVIAIWAPRPGLAARVPALLVRMFRDSATRPPTLVLGPGGWAPRFALGHVDAIVAWPNSLLTPDALRPLVELKSSRTVLTGNDVAPCLRESGFDLVDDVASCETGPRTADECPARAGSLPESTPQIAEIFGSTAMTATVATRTIPGDPQAPFRDPDVIVHDAESAFRRTGCEGIRFHDPIGEAHPNWSDILVGLNKRLPLRRLRIETDPMSIDDFETRMSGHHPLHLQPELAIAIDPATDMSRVDAAVRRALGDGWRTVRLVLRIDDFASLPEWLAGLARLAKEIARHIRSYPDKRYLHFAFDPRPPGNDPEHYLGVESNLLREIDGAVRRFAERMPRAVVVHQWEPKETIAEATLAAADPALWDRLVDVPPGDATDDRRTGDRWHDWLAEHDALPATDRSDASSPTAAPRMRQVVSREVATQPGGQEPAQETPATTATTDMRFGRRTAAAQSTRRPATVPRHRIRLRWHKTERMRFTSHLEMARMFERIVRRASLPVEYSEGFHPRMKLAFGPPLPLGMTSESELLDIVLESPAAEQHVAALRSALPQGLTVGEYRFMPTRSASLGEIVNLAVYDIAVSRPIEELRASTTAVLDAAELHLTDDDNGKPAGDLRDHLYDLEVLDEPDTPVLRVSLKLGVPGALKPTQLLEGIFALSHEEAISTHIHRRRLLVLRGADTLDPLNTT